MATPKWMVEKVKAGRSFIGAMEGPRYNWKSELHTWTIEEHDCLPGTKPLDIYKVTETIGSKSKTYALYIPQGEDYFVKSADSWMFYR